MIPTMAYKKNQVNPYLSKEILEASQQKLLLKVYDYAIVNCQKHDMPKTNKAISVLIEALNFDAPEAREIAVGLYRLYQFSQEQMRRKNYDIVYKILTDLRETWLGVFRKESVKVELKES